MIEQRDLLKEHGLVLFLLSRLVDVNDVNSSDQSHSYSKRRVNNRILKRSSSINR